MQLVRNLEKRYVEDFFDRGDLQVHSLLHYREKADPSRRDKQEGLRGMPVHPTTSITTKPDSMWLPNGVFIKGTRPGLDPVIFLGAGSRGEFYERLPPAYVLCVSEERNDKFGDGGFAINNAEAFGNQLASALAGFGREIVGWSLRQMRYGEHKDTSTNQADFDSAVRSLNAADPFDDYFLKPSEFASEREWRFLFGVGGGDDEPPDPVMVRDAKLVAYCSRT